MKRAAAPGGRQRHRVLGHKEKNIREVGTPSNWTSTYLIAQIEHG